MRTTPGSVMADSASGASMAAATVAADCSAWGCLRRKFNPVALACQLHGEQAAHEAGAQNCEG